MIPKGKGATITEAQVVALVEDLQRRGFRTEREPDLRPNDIRYSILIPDDRKITLRSGCAPGLWRICNGPTSGYAHEVGSESELRTRLFEYARSQGVDFAPPPASNFAPIGPRELQVDGSKQPGDLRQAPVSPEGAQRVAEVRDPVIDFAILTAIEVERRAVCEAFGLGEGDRVNKDSRVYWRGTLSLKGGEAYEVVVAQSPDAGNTDAAILTNDMLHHWHPGSALLVGIAASADAKVKLGDVVVGSDVYYYERGKETPEGTKSEPKIIPADATLWNRVTTVPDWDGNVAAQRPDGADDKPKLHYGVIASGEKVVANRAVRDQIAAGHRKILAIEMEGWGFSRAVWQSFEQVRHLDIRGICDDASEKKDDRWHQYAAAAAAAFARHFLLDRPLAPRGEDRARPR